MGQRRWTQLTVEGQPGALLEQTECCIISWRKKERLKGRGWQPQVVRVQAQGQSSAHRPHRLLKDPCQPRP